MIGRQKTYSVQLTEEEKKLLQQLGLARKTGQSKARRAKVIIKVDENPDWTDAQIAGEIGCSSGLVRKWRQYGSDKHFSLSLGSGERMYSKPAILILKKNQRKFCYLNRELVSKHHF